MSTASTFNQHMDVVLESLTAMKSESEHNAAVTNIIRRLDIMESSTIGAHSGKIGQQRPDIEDHYYKYGNRQLEKCIFVQEM